jgi:hypothetical protein
VLVAGAVDRTSSTSSTSSPDAGGPAHGRHHVTDRRRHRASDAAGIAARRLARAIVATEIESIDERGLGILAARRRLRP